MATATHSGPAAVIDRLMKATNAHDVDAIVDCFSPDYVNQTPVHPERGFTGNEQVRRNWTAILGAVKDVEASVMRMVVDGDTVWTEQAHRGHRADGSVHEMAGMVIFGVADDLITWARFSLEPVQAGGGDVNEMVARQLAPGGRP
jgi:ketosteroid isomerase-like protein